MITLFVKNLVFTILVPGTVAVLGPKLLASNPIIFSTWSIGAGYFFLLLGLVIYLWCVWDFATFGKGTPAPIDAPKRLVVRGIYRYTRNPMYIGVLSFILGWTFLYSDLVILIYWVFVAVIFQLFVKLYEEPQLEQLFGEEYLEYIATVGRWL